LAVAPPPAAARLIVAAAAASVVERSFIKGFPQADGLEWPIGR
jgi:hypothetical protein